MTRDEKRTRIDEIEKEIANGYYTYDDFRRDITNDVWENYEEFINSSSAVVKSIKGLLENARISSDSMAHPDDSEEIQWGEDICNETDKDVLKFLLQISHNCFDLNKENSVGENMKEDTSFLMALFELIQERKSFSYVVDERLISTSKVAHTMDFVLDLLRSGINLKTIQQGYHVRGDIELKALKCVIETNENGTEYNYYGLETDTFKITQLMLIAELKSGNIDLSRLPLSCFEDKYIGTLINISKERIHEEYEKVRKFKKERHEESGQSQYVWKAIDRNLCQHEETEVEKIIDIINLKQKEFIETIETKETKLTEKKEETTLDIDHEIDRLSSENEFLLNTIKCLQQEVEANNKQIQNYKNIKELDGQEEFRMLNGSHID